MKFDSTPKGAAIRVISLLILGVASVQCADQQQHTSHTGFSLHMPSIFQHHHDAPKQENGVAAAEINANLPHNPSLLGAQENGQQVTEVVGVLEETVAAPHKESGFFGKLGRHRSSVVAEPSIVDNNVEEAPKGADQHPHDNVVTRTFHRFEETIESIGHHKNNEPSKDAGKTSDGGFLSRLGRKGKKGKRDTKGQGANAAAIAEGAELTETLQQDDDQQTNKPHEESALEHAKHVLERELKDTMEFVEEGAETMLEFAHDDLIKPIIHIGKDVVNDAEIIGRDLEHVAEDVFGASVQLSEDLAKPAIHLVEDIVEGTLHTGEHMLEAMEREVGLHPKPDAERILNLNPGATPIEEEIQHVKEKGDDEEEARKQRGIDDQEDIDDEEEEEYVDPIEDQVKVTGEREKERATEDGKRTTGEASQRSSPGILDEINEFLDDAPRVIEEAMDEVADAVEDLFEPKKKHEEAAALASYSLLPIGNTPMAELKNLEVPFSLYAKCEFANPTKSGKDRIALSMFNAAIKDGRIVLGGKKKPTVIVSSAGASGASFAMVGASLGIRVVVAAPRDLGEEYVREIAAYGGKVVHPAEGKSYKNLAAYLSKKNPNWVVLDHAFDPKKPETTSYSLINEMVDDLWKHKVRPDMIVVGVVSGRTLTAVVNASRKDPNIKIVAVVLDDSEDQKRTEYLQSLKIHKWVTVSEKHATKAAALLAQREGMLVGINSGAVMYAALSSAKKAGLGENSNVVVVLPDALFR